MITLAGFAFFGTVAVFARGVVQVVAIAGVIALAAVDGLVQARAARRRGGDRGVRPEPRSPHEPYETLPEKAARLLVTGGTVRFDDRLVDHFKDTPR